MTLPYTVMASGKIRECAYDALKDKVKLLSWQQGGRMPQEQFDEWLAQADAIFSISNFKANEEFLAKAPKLKVIGQSAVGYDNIDVAACHAHGVRVGNTPGVLVDDVADLSYALLIDSARRIVKAHAHVASGLWGQRKPFGVTTALAGKTLGIIGMGDIGSAIAKRAQVSKMRVVYHNRHQRSDDAALDVTYLSLEELLASSDFVLVAVTLNPSTKGLMNAERFAIMKPGACFINISRGGVVDTEALYDALVSGQIGYAAMDVTDPEPLPGEHKLLSLENVTVTPHMASATKETRDAMALLTAENILAGLKGEALLAQVPVK